MIKTEEEVFTDLMITLLFEGEVEDHLIEETVHHMMDNPELYPEYF